MKIRDRIGLQQPWLATKGNYACRNYADLVDTYHWFPIAAQIDIPAVYHWIVLTQGENAGKYIFLDEMKSILNSNIVDSIILKIH